MKIVFISLGCDKNLVDTEMMLGMLSEKGYSFTDDENEADTIYVSTKTVAGEVTRIKNETDIILPDEYLYDIETSEFILNEDINDSDIYITLPYNSFINENKEICINNINFTLDSISFVECDGNNFMKLPSEELIFENSL